MINRSGFMELRIRRIEFASGVDWRGYFHKDFSLINTNIPEEWNPIPIGERKQEKDGMKHIHTGPRLLVFFSFDTINTTGFVEAKHKGSPEGSKRKEKGGCRFEQELGCYANWKDNNRLSEDGCVDGLADEYCTHLTVSGSTPVDLYFSPPLPP